jgi:hypothetical protein
MTLANDQEDPVARLRHCGDIRLSGDRSKYFSAIRAHDMPTIMPGTPARFGRSSACQAATGRGTISMTN